MPDQDKSKQLLLDELAEMRQRVAALEQSLAEQQQSSEFLQQAEAKWHSVVANTPVFVCIVDRAGTIQYLNRTVPGITMEEAIGRSTYNFIKPDYWEIARECIERVFDTGQPAFYEGVSAGPNGSSSWYESFVGPVKVGDHIVAVTLVANDITRRKAAEETLAESEAQLLEAQEVANLGFSVVDLATGRITTSPVLDRIFGIPDDYERTLDEWANLVHPDDRQAMQGYLQEVVGEKKRFDREYRIVRYGDKQVRWVHGRGRLQFSADGQPVSILGTVQDITERKLAEAALQKAHDELEQRVETRTAELREANERLQREVEQRQSIAATLQQSHDELQAMHDGMFDGLLLVEVESKRFVKANPSICRLLGYSEQELLTMSLPDIHLPEDLPDVLQRIEARAEGCFQGYATVRLVRKDGSLVWADIASNPLAYRGRLCVAGFFRDMTERKQAEEVLRQNHDELQAMYDGMFDGLLMVDVESKRFLRANASICRMLGYTEVELLAMSVMDIHPVDEIPVALGNIQARTEGRLQGHVDTRLLRKDGGVLYADVVSGRLTYCGRPSLAAFFRDVTEHRQAEVALQKEHRTLKHLLQSSDHERQLIAYEIHDGLAQQLAGAIMQIQAFQHLKDKNPQEAAKAFAAGLTMLQQGHVEARRLIAGVRPPILDESGVVEAVAHLVHEVGRDKGPQIDFHSRVEFDRLDPTLENAIYRIAQEALTNASQHGQSARIWISLLQRGDRVRIEIRDWGIGFDPQSVPKSRFGLEGIRQRARLLGGKCSIRSSAGKGTRVTVDLPVVPRGE